MALFKDRGHSGRKPDETLGVDRNVISVAARQEHKELERREKKYRGDQPAIEVTGKTVPLGDDCLTTPAGGQPPYNTGMNELEVI